MGARKLPQDVDDLLWSVAEDAKPEVMDEFASRFPEHKAELVRRIQMVRQLKGARPKGAGAHRPFKPEPGPARRPDFRLLYAFAGAVLLAACVFAGMTIQKLYLSPAPTVPAPAPVAVNEPRIPDPQIEVKPEQKDPAPAAQNEGTAPGELPSGPFDRRITVEYDRASLSEVLNDIALKSGVRLQAAPGMPDVVVEARYYDLPAITILNDLGRNFGFTPLKQTDREALLIPAIDPSRPPAASTEGYAAEIPKGQADGTGASGSRKKTEKALPPVLSGPIGR